MPKQKPIQRRRLQSMGNTFYEAAQYNGQRSQAWLAFPQTAEKEFSYYNRRTILRKKRYLEANLSIIGGLIEKESKYVVGRGILPMPCTADDAWNDQTTGDFIDWASNPVSCDAMGMQDFWSMQSYMAESLFGEGEGFAAMVSSSIADSPQLQLIDPGEVEYFSSPGIPPALLNPGEFSYFDGVKLNSKNRIVAYSVRTTDAGGDGGSVDVDVANMIHLCKRKRPNQYRALSPFANVANSGVDALDLRALEMATYKLHSALAIIYTKNQGSVGPGGLSDQLKTLLSTTTTEAGNEMPTGQTAIGEEVFAGAMIKHAGNGEDVKLLASPRQALNIIQFLEWFYRDISAGTGRSLEIVWNLAGLGGVNARINLADIQACYDKQQGILNQQFNRRVYIWWLSKKFQDGYPMPNDPKWWNCHWLGPAKITGDAGNTAKALVELLNSGFGTWAEFWASLGKSWKNQITQRVLEVKFAEDECKRIGVDYTKVFPPAAGAAAAAPSLGGGGPSGGDGGGGIST